MQKITSHRRHIKALEYKLRSLQSKSTASRKPVAQTTGAGPRICMTHGLDALSPHSGWRFSGIVDWLDNRRRQATGEGFRHNDAEGLLMGGQAEKLGAAESVPLELATEHAVAIGDTDRDGMQLQGGLPAHLIGAGDQQLQAWVGVGHSSKASTSRSTPFLGWMRPRKSRKR